MSVTESKTVCEYECECGKHTSMWWPVCSSSQCVFLCMWPCFLCVSECGYISVCVCASVRVFGCVQLCMFLSISANLDISCICVCVCVTQSGVSLECGKGNALFLVLFPPTPAMTHACAPGPQTQSGCEHGSGGGSLRTIRCPHTDRKKSVGKGLRPHQERGAHGLGREAG